MKSLCDWSLHYTAGLWRLYRQIAAQAPLVRWMGSRRAARLIIPLEHSINSAFVDCRMCGGVRPDGGCEIKPQMHCAWLDATDGASANCYMSSVTATSVLATAGLEPVC